MKKLAIVCTVLLVVSALSSCGKRSGESSVRSGARDSAAGTVPVSVTFNALAEITRAVGGEFVSVTTIVPDGTEPHDFEPKARDLVALGNASVFVHNGLGLEYWIDDALAAAGNDTLVVVDASAGIDPIEIGGGEGSGVDPHSWLSLSGAKIQTANIAEALARVDPSHAEECTKNAAAFTAEIDSLLSEYTGKLADAPSRIFVTGHAAFGYLCRDFTLEQNSVEDVFVSGEPKAQDLVSLVRFCREKGVKTIFVEEMVSPAVSMTLAKEVGAKVETIYTLESSEDGKSYLERMRSNLEKISESLNK